MLASLILIKTILGIVGVIKLTNIHKVYQIDKNREFEALKGIDLTIEKGEIFGVIGLSGAGKSTLIRHINMLERPTVGTVEVDGKVMNELNPKELSIARRSIGMIFQQFNLLSSMTVEQNVAFPLEMDESIDKNTIKARVLELLKMVGLEDKAQVYPAQLSGGQKQRVGIARALASNPKVLLCDEATSALDPKTTSSILKLLLDLRKKLNLTIVIITHQMEVIKECCDRVAVIDGGLISEIGTTLEIFANPKQPLTKRLVTAAVRKDITDLLSYTTLYPYYREGYRALVELLFLGNKAEDPVIIEVAKKTSASISILAGAINHIQSKPLGILVVAIGGDKNTIDTTIEEFKSRVYKLEFLGYEDLEATLANNQE